MADDDKPKLGTKVTYIDVDGSAPKVSMHGIDFEDGKSVDVKEHFKDPDQLEAFQKMCTGNPWFEIEGGPKRERPKKAAPAAKADDDDDDKGGARLEHGAAPRGGPARR